MNSPVWLILINFRADSICCFSIHQTKSNVFNCDANKRSPWKINVILHICSNVLSNDVSVAQTVRVSNATRGCQIYTKVWNKNRICVYSVTAMRLIDGVCQYDSISASDLPTEINILFDNSPCRTGRG